MSTRGENDKGTSLPKKKKSVVRSMSRRLPQSSAVCKSITAADFHNGGWPSLNQTSTYTVILAMRHND